MGGKLGGPVWGWFTGWFNLLGLIAILASVDYFAGQFLDIILGLYNVNILGMNFGDGRHGCGRRSCCSSSSSRCTSSSTSAAATSSRVLNGISVWWHVLGVAVIVGDPDLRPDHHASFDLVFTEPQNNSGFSAERCSGGTCCRSASC